MKPLKQGTLQRPLCSGWVVATRYRDGEWFAPPGMVRRTRREALDAYIGVSRTEDRAVYARMATRYARARRKGRVQCVRVQVRETVKLRGTRV